MGRQYEGDEVTVQPSLASRLPGRGDRVLAQSVQLGRVDEVDSCVVGVSQQLVAEPGRPVGQLEMGPPQPLLGRPVQGGTGPYEVGVVSVQQASLLGVE